MATTVNPSSPVSGSLGDQVLMPTDTREMDLDHKAVNSTNESEDMETIQVNSGHVGNNEGRTFSYFPK